MLVSPDDGLLAMLRQAVATLETTDMEAPDRAVAMGTSGRLDSDPGKTRYGCFLPDLTGLARRLPAPTSRRWK